MIGTLRMHIHAKEVAAELKAARLARGLSQQACAAALGVSVRTISRWESGRGRLHRVWLARVRALAENGAEVTADALKQV